MRGVVSGSVVSQDDLIAVCSRDAQHARAIDASLPHQDGAARQSGPATENRGPLSGHFRSGVLLGQGQGSAVTGSTVALAHARPHQQSASPSSESEAPIRESMFTTACDQFARTVLRFGPHPELEAEQADVLAHVETVYASSTKN